jgi:hypothetical protein
MGIGQEYVDALKTISQKLADQPLAWGDPQYRLPALGLLICHRVHSLLHVWYGVDEESRIVYLEEIKPRPGHPLDRGS